MYTVGPIIHTQHKALSAFRDTTRDPQGANVQSMDLRLVFSQQSQITLAHIRMFDFQHRAISPYEDASFLSLHNSAGRITHKIDESLIAHRDAVKADDMHQLMTDLSQILLSIAQAGIRVTALRLILQPYAVSAHDVHVDAGGVIGTASLSDDEGLGTIFVGTKEGSPAIDLGISTPLGYLQRLGDFHVFQAKPWELALSNQAGSVYPVAHSAPHFQPARRGQARLLLLMN